MKVTINGVDMEAKDASFTLERPAIEGTFEPWDIPEIKGTITGLVDEDVIRRLTGPRKLFIETTNPRIFSVFSPRIRYEFDGLVWQVYRRDFKRLKVFMKEVIDDNPRT